MIKILRVLTVALALTMLMVTNSYSYEAHGDNDVVRLHVLANSNSPEDQLVKYKVRDEILAQFTPHFSEIESAIELEQFIEDNIEEINKIADSTLVSNGFSYESTISIGKFEFPSRLYLEKIYPAGEYEAVKIVLGEGKGDNWWCVMFPPLCFVGESSPSECNDFSHQKQNKEEEKQVEYRFKFFDVIKSLFSKIFS
ncbi:stage II sporulation protein R [Proteinivorax hydrogeniformans]|uniref:Stage II sporulation protein R n=1 Tax=Proteinivorax hydrogeniformans TaxID=1826727 RepID=A0AAU8HSS4_9FIRM